MTNTNIPTTGFHTNPERINRNGAPKREWTWSGLLEQIGEEIEVKSGQKFKDLVSKRLWIDAVNGSLGAQKEILNRMDGLPIAKQEIYGKDGSPLSINIIAYGNNDPIQLQTNEVHDTSVSKLKEISSSQLAQKSSKDDTGDKSTDTVGS